MTETARRRQALSAWLLGPVLGAGVGAFIARSGDDGDMVAGAAALALVSLVGWSSGFGSQTDRHLTASRPQRDRRVERAEGLALYGSLLGVLMLGAWFIVMDNAGALYQQEPLVWTGVVVGSLNFLLGSALGRLWSGSMLPRTRRVVTISGSSAVLVQAGLAALVFRGPGAHQLTPWSWAFPLGACAALFALCGLVYGVYLLMIRRAFTGEGG